MKHLVKSGLRFLAIFLFLILSVQVSSSQPIPEELSKSPLREQLNYLEDHTRIYENFRAIREDIFQRIKKNITDTLNFSNKKIADLNRKNSALASTIDSLNSNLSSTRTSLDDITRTKNSVNLLGMEVSKSTYNTIMWSIIIVLLLILLIGFLVFKRNQTVVNNRKKDLEDLKAEFEAYRKTSREAREKMALQHFNELKRLRGE